MTLLQLTALVGLLCILYAFVLVYGSLRRGESPSDNGEARVLVGVWMVLALALQVVALVS